VGNVGFPTNWNKVKIPAVCRDDSGAETVESLLAPLVGA
jgi:hypothetical protein